MISSQRNVSEINIGIISLHIGVNITLNVSQ